ncbi:MAG: hypothetical protein UT05_C0006G0009 [Parcubacteria group bacterium GW2011_GWF2_38_76]|nr:MAG: hypothetical protein UT05_C0006G0009 [Parcubacteria group bacterium GW2011_GWF2_38_76]HBM45890.1 hypothetical protein [Patescibacteria group bacterium]
MVTEIKNDGNNECENNRKWSLTAKVIGTILAILLALFVGITALGYYWPDIQNYRYKMEAERFQKEIDAERARISALEKADTFGGKTPEETFDMFLVALNKGDVELASKYYDVTVQDVALLGLKKELTEEGNLEMSIKYFTDVRGGEKKCNRGATGCVFEYEVIKGFESLSLRSNPQNNLWKITQPY